MARSCSEASRFFGAVSLAIEQGAQERGREGWVLPAARASASCPPAATGMPPPKQPSLCHTVMRCEDAACQRVFVCEVHASGKHKNRRAVRSVWGIALYFPC